jgi:Holliday junction resolvase-like predicted endonuclease
MRQFQERTQGDPHCDQRAAPHSTLINFPSRAPAGSKLQTTIDQSVKEERRGAKGEELIGAMLEQLGDRFLVFHDLPSPYGNIDHLVVSKETVFLIETKAYGGRVNVVNGQIQVNQRAPEKDFIAQVVRNTAWLSAQADLNPSPPPLPPSPQAKVGSS